jgi:hypothetical protein
VGTLRVQLKSILSKTDTHRQAELVALLNRLAIISLPGPSESLWFRFCPFSHEGQTPSSFPGATASNEHQLPNGI